MDLPNGTTLRLAASGGEPREKNPLQERLLCEGILCRIFGWISADLQWGQRVVSGEKWKRKRSGGSPQDVAVSSPSLPDTGFLGA